MDKVQHIDLNEIRKSSEKFSDGIEILTNPSCGKACPFILVLILRTWSSMLILYDNTLYFLLFMKKSKCCLIFPIRLSFT